MRLQEFGHIFTTDADECAEGNVCGQGRCTNLQGGFECECNPGFAPGMSGQCEGR